jgi:glycosyltransferase involved in cell wall biosynthesis
MSVQLPEVEEQVEPGPSVETPSVSVVVPVYNDAEGLETTLEALLGQTYADYEVLVVDNRSTDETRAIAGRYAERSDRVTVLEERRRQSSYAARVRGIRWAEGDVVAFVDADMTVEADWLERSIDRMLERDLDYMGCRVELYTDGEESLLGAYNRLNGFPVDTYVSELQFAPTCCLLVRREVLETVGPFDTRFVSSGDREFGQRVAAAGFDIGLAEDVPMYHPTRTTLDALVSKAVRVGRGKYQLRQYYPERYGTPALLPVYPGLYTPPSPKRMGDTLRNWEELSTPVQVLFYLLTYALKLAKASGVLREAAAVPDR